MDTQDEGEHLQERVHIDGCRREGLAKAEHEELTKKANSSVVRLCRVRGILTSGFHAWQWRQPSQRAGNEAELIEHIAPFTLS